MALQTIQQRKRGFICVNSHPEGCRKNVSEQVRNIAAAAPTRLDGPKKVLVLGSSTGYGLASRIASAWGFGAATLGVCFERPPKEGSTATAGYYNTAAFHEAARKAGLLAETLNGDAFSDEIKRQTAELIRKHLGTVELIIYSLASPRRVHPRTGETHDSALKPVGRSFTSKTIDLKSEAVVEVTLPPAEEKEIRDTVAVMGGEDWRFWIEMLLGEGLLAPGARTLAYSYIGPEVTWPIYKDGTIGRAKQDLEAASRHLNALLEEKLGGGAWVSVNKAAVTQASSAIPVVPLYLSILPIILREKGADETPIDQMRRLMFDFVARRNQTLFDDRGRIRLDRAELEPDVQSRIAEIWVRVSTENLLEITDFAGFKRAFDSLFGFHVEGVDYSQPAETDLSW